MIVSPSSRIAEANQVLRMYLGMAEMFCPQVGGMPQRIRCPTPVMENGKAEHGDGRPAGAMGPRHTLSRSLW